MACPGFQRGGVLKVRPDAQSGGGGGGGGGGCCRFLAQYERRGIRKAGGGGGVLSVSGPIRKAGGGGCCRFLARYEKGGGGGGGGGGGQARIQNVLEGGAEKLARKLLATTPILVFILEAETEGGARAP